jgi:hypothetical protein
MSQAPTDLRKRRLQEVRDADGATAAKGFHPEIPMLQHKAPSNGTLNRGTTPKDAATIATD